MDRCDWTIPWQGDRVPVAGGRRDGGGNTPEKSHRVYSG
jgi:hypothetical protein